MSTPKELGTKAFSEKNFDQAIEQFTLAIEQNPSDHALFSNRSACFWNKNEFDKALEDAEECIKVKPDWAKGYMRKGLALQGKKDFDTAMDAYTKGLEIEPNNEQLKTNLAKCQQASQGGGGLGGMFGGPEAMQKLMSNPKIAEYFKDPQFSMMFQMCQQNPQMLMQLMQTDPRYMEVFQVLTGLDLSQMQQPGGPGGAPGGAPFGGPSGPTPEEQEAARKMAEEEAKAREEEKKRAEQAAKEAAMTDEEKKERDQKAAAEKKKAEGNEFYKKKQYEQALTLYKEAIELNPNEINYYNNVAAVNFQQEDFNGCIEWCDKAIQKSKEGHYDYKKLAKSMARKANALAKLDKLDESLALFKDALLEDNDYSIKDQMKKVEQVRREKERLAYLSPEKGEEHRVKGNEFFQEGKFREAIAEYDEGLKRDPENVKIYSNRCFAYIKVLDLANALKDAEKCLEMDPKMVKAWIRKGNVHHLMKEYHKAISAYDSGLKLEPENADLKQGKMKTMMAIQTGATDGKTDEERMRHAMADPEIQGLMRDPRVVQVLKELQENPRAAQDSLRDPFLAEAINKLVAAGVLKMG